MSETPPLSITPQAPTILSVLYIGVDSRISEPYEKPFCKGEEDRKNNAIDSGTTVFLKLLRAAHAFHCTTNCIIELLNKKCNLIKERFVFDL